MFSSFEKVGKALEESVVGLIDTRIENVKSMILNVEGKQKTLLAGKTDEIKAMRSHVEEIESNVKALTSHEIATIETLQKEVEELTNKLANIETETKAVRVKLETLSGVLSRQTEFRRSLRGVF